jgi:hypothetical protein
VETIAMDTTPARRILPRLVPAALLAILAAACTDGANPLVQEGPRTPDAPGGVLPLATLECTASRASMRVTCEPAHAAPRGDIILGNGSVKLTSSNVHYDGVTEEFTFDVTVKNLIQQPIGTTDGATVDPNGIQVFFQSGPNVTSGSGDIEVVPDGIGAFITSNQPYYQYTQLLVQNAVSSPRTWTLLVPATVNTFAFLVYVAAPVQYPNGYVQLNGYLPGVGSDSLQVGTTHSLATVVKNAVGNTVPGATVTYSSSDPSCATVDASGTVTGVAVGSCTISATSGTKPGRITVNVIP